MEVSPRVFPNRHADKFTLDRQLAFVDKLLNLSTEIDKNPHRFTTRPGIVGAVGGAHRWSLPRNKLESFEIRTRILV
jgi:hypothetical protein